MNPWLSVPLLILGIWGWFMARSMIRLRSQLDESEARLARRFYKLQGRLTEMDAIVRELDFERRRKSGEIRFSGDQKIEDAVAIHPRVAEILAAFGLAGSGCGGGGTLNVHSTLAETCREHHLDLESVLESLNRFVENPEGPIEAQPATAKLYQLQAPPRQDRGGTSA
ncbi:MAG: hypothetical protein HKN12_06880 [Gemmatimonadetes bacterium]|nr:hypothetical protein [Gemmatimonadota bacterium]